MRRRTCMTSLSQSLPLTGFPVALLLSVHVPLWDTDVHSPSGDVPAWITHGCCPLGMFLPQQLLWPAQGSSWLPPIQSTTVAPTTLTLSLPWAQVTCHLEKAEVLFHIGWEQGCPDWTGPSLNNPQLGGITQTSRTSRKSQKGFIRDLHSHFLNSVLVPSTGPYFLSHYMSAPCREV